MGSSTRQSAFHGLPCSDQQRSEDRGLRFACCRTRHEAVGKNDYFQRAFSAATLSTSSAHQRRHALVRLVPYLTSKPRAPKLNTASALTCLAASGTQGAAAEAPPRRRRISKCRLPSLTSIKTDSAALPLEGIIEQRKMEAITPKDWRHASDLQACDAQRRRRACGIVFTHAKFGLRSAKLVASRSSRSLLDRITPTLGGVQRHDDHCLC